mgnify:CR=1 FL=1
MKICLSAALPLAALGLLTTAAAHAHEHGVTDLTIVQSDNHIQISLHSPMANLAGFEGPANTPERQAALMALQTRLALPLLTIQGCQQTAMTAPLLPLDEPQSDHEHEHEHEHEHDNHDGHPNQHDEQAHASQHSDLDVDWEFACLPDARALLTTRLFEYFPGISTLKLQWITDDGQGAARWQQDGELSLQ